MSEKKLIDSNGLILFRFKKAKRIEDEVTVDRLNALIQAINMSCLVSLVNGKFSKSIKGMVAACFGTGGSGSFKHPYKPYDASVGSTPKVKIQYGLHNSIPLLIDGVPISVNLDDNVLTLDAGAKIVYARLDLDEYGVPTGGSIQYSTDTEPPEKTDTEAYETLFGCEVTISGGIASVVFAESVFYSRSFQRCGENDNFWS